MDLEQTEADCLYVTFFIQLQVSTRLWRRQHVGYSSYPWKLAQIANPLLPQQKALEMATDFLSAKECCLDEGFSLRLRRLANNPESLLQGGPLHPLLELLSAQKPLNAEIEDNFARHNSAARAARGPLAAY